MSDLAISSVNNSQLQFKGVKRTEQGNTYYNTHRGTTLGIFTGVPVAAIAAAPAVGISLIQKSGKENIAKLEESARNLIKEASEYSKKSQVISDSELGQEFIRILDHPNCVIKELKSIAKSIKKPSIYAAIGAAVLAIGSGITADSIRNKKAKSAADAIASGNTEGRKDIEYSKKGNQYCKTKVGSRMGLILGAAAGASTEMLLFKNKNPLGIIIGTAISALSGWVLGKLNDHGVNRKAARKADEVAAAQNS